MKKRILAWFALFLGAALLVLGAVLFTPSPASADPTIKWIPASLKETIQAGESKTIPVSFVTSENITDAKVAVSPALKPYVKVWTADE